MTNLDQMPVELLGLIFSHINLSELLRMHVLVCRRWMEVITSKDFLPLRKIFYRYQADVEDTRVNLRLEVLNRLKEIPDTFGRVIATQNKQDSLERCLPYILEKFAQASTLTLLKLENEDFAAVTGHSR